MTSNHCKKVEKIIKINIKKYKQDSAVKNLYYVFLDTWKTKITKPELEDWLKAR